MDAGNKGKIRFVAKKKSEAGFPNSPESPTSATPNGSTAGNNEPTSPSSSQSNPTGTQSTANVTTPANSNTTETPKKTTEDITATSTPTTTTTSTSSPTTNTTSAPATNTDNSTENNNTSSLQNTPNNLKRARRDSAPSSTTKSPNAADTSMESVESIQDEPDSEDEQEEDDDDQTPAKQAQPEDEDEEEDQDEAMTDIAQPKKRGRKPKLKNIKKRLQLEQELLESQNNSPNTTSTPNTPSLNSNNNNNADKGDIESPQSKRQSKKPRKYDEEEEPIQPEKPERVPNKVGRPKRVQPQEEAMEDSFADPEAEVSEKKSKKSKKSVPNSLDIRPCWFSTCSKADRSLKILRPCLIPTCKTHAIKSESRIYEMLGKGFCIEEKGNKDTVCGVCGETKQLSHCANDDCAFGFCEACTNIIVSKHSNAPNGPKWVCWVCNSVKLRGKDRERTRWVREIVQPNSLSAPRKPRTPKVVPSNLAPTLSQSQLLQQQQLQLQGTQAPMLEDGTPAGPGRRKKKIAANPDYEVNTYRRGRKRGYEDDSAPPSPTGSSSNNNNNSITNTDVSPDLFTYHSIMSPERDPVSPVDFFIDQSFNSIKFFNSILQNPPSDAMEQFNNMIKTISRLRTIRWSNDYQMVWRAIEELGTLFKRNLDSSQTIISMQSEIKGMTDEVIKSSNNNTRNQPLERAISRVFEHHQLSNQIEKECTSTRNILLIAIDGAHKTIEEITQNYELDVLRDKHNEERFEQELLALDDQLKVVNGEIQILKQQEAELLEQLSRVRSSLSQLEGLRDSYARRASDIKIESLLSNNAVAERELDARTKRATLENEIGALNALLTLIEGVYWGHEFFYTTEIGECEKAISEKLIEINRKIDLARNDIPLAISLKPAAIREVTDGSNAIVTSEENQEEKLVTFLNPFKTLAIYHTACMDHNVPDYHLERPDRIRVAINTINDFVTRYPGIVEVYNTPPEVELRYVMAVHDAHYIKKLETQLPPENSDMETHLESDQTGAMITVTQKEGGDDDDIYDTFISHRSMKAAMRAAGSVCAAVDAVTKLGYHRTFCAIRPPGHHAGRFGRTSDAPSQGYCLINNVAIGAKYASLTAGYSRIAVVDFDVHHGNGTQEILSGDDNFLFVSIHVCDEKRYFYPGTGRDLGDDIHEDGSYDGNVLNIGLKRNSGSSTFIQAWTKRIIPRLEAYKPQLIFLSAGFDGHKDDPTNGLKLTEDDYFTITKMIKAVAAKHSRGRVISVLEGGYGIEKGNSLQKCLNMHLKALVEDSNNEILYSQASSGDFGLIKKIFNSNTASTIRDPTKKGDMENVALFNSIAKDYMETIRQSPTIQGAQSPSLPQTPNPSTSTNNSGGNSNNNQTQQQQSININTNNSVLPPPPLTLLNDSSASTSSSAGATTTNTSGANTTATNNTSDKTNPTLKSSPTASTNVVNPKPPLLPAINSQEPSTTTTTTTTTNAKPIHSLLKIVNNNDNNNNNNNQPHQKDKNVELGGQLNTRIETSSLNNTPNN